MPLPDNWIRRKRARESSSVDPLTYDELPRQLRVQILNVLHDAIGYFREIEPWDMLADRPPSNGSWAVLEKVLSHEFGMFRLGNDSNNWTNFANFFLATTDVDQALLCIEYALRLVDGSVRQRNPYETRQSHVSLTPDDAISEINARLLENSLGYQWLSGHIVQVDNQVIHSELIVPALELLSDPAFAGPNAEFLNAHEHFREGRHREAIVDAARAFESSMRVICDHRGWAYSAGATAKTLIGVLITHGLFPTYLQTQFSSLQSLLESGAPTVRNKTSAHGGGATPLPVPPHLASYAISLSAANIVLLVAADQELS